LEKIAFVPLERLSEEPYASIICYPKPSEIEVRKRLWELQKLGVTALEFVGEKQAFNVPVLGKGCVGIVILAYMKDEKVALKVRRVDADRARMQREARLLEKANSEHVGPELLAVSKNFLLMQFVEGQLLPKWLEKKRNKERIRRVLHEILEQCWRLDRISLDHGELSHAPKHVIIDYEDRPCIVDFESASLDRKPSNVTAMCQFLFIGSEIAKKVAKKLGEKDKKAIIGTLRRYKNDRTLEDFGKLLEICGL
jgi:putative serine/threonine protein kinase